jgi:hypothetical protein
MRRILSNILYALGDAAYCLSLRFDSHLCGIAYQKLMSAAFRVRN